ncbi:hypothetical protein O1W71_11830 [Microbacterium sp. H37-C3]|uniref:hypothetical protein n=1 Tax=Microbacterium sp. H37-C3 TaxID=3004354 RepID=UPI0022AF645F|nr:hypothetical protein [Microbacterium sp. H37-C3]MCZ4068359.1 hypothetical protein [Microbacterium sp. H37-C3]
MNLDLVLRAVSRTMPAASRARHLEQWRADVAGAHEAGVRRGDVVRGAIAVALSADRDSPVLTGEPRGTASRRLSRRGVTLLTAVGATSAALWLTGDRTSPAVPIPAAVEIALAVGRSALSVLLFGGVLLAIALFIGAAALSRSAVVRLAFAVTALGIPVLALAAVRPVAAGVSAAGVGLTVGGAAIGLAGAWRSTPLALEDRSAPLARRRPVAIAGLVSVTAVLVLGALDLLVWNPLAKVPGYELDAIYAAMIAADGFDPAFAAGAVAVWGGVWLVAAAGVAVGALTRGGAWLTPRRLGILYLSIIGAALFLRLFAGFSIGMSIADTFATSGGDVSALSQVFHLIGPLSFAAALLLFGWAPAGRRTTGVPVAAD